MQRVERMDGRVIAFDPHHGKRLSQEEIEALRLDAVCQIARENNRLTRQKIFVYLGLAIFLTAFWAGVIMLLERW